jgi:outer membrane protein TolC
MNRSGFAILFAMMTAAPLLAQSGAPEASATVPAPVPAVAAARASTFALRRSLNPLAPYTGVEVAAPEMRNSVRLTRLISDGKLRLTLRDAIDLALENNLDLAIARYNLPIAETDVLRTRAGASARGVNTGVVQGTPGGGQGGFGTSGSGAGAGGTSSGAGGAGAGASGLVQSMLGTGSSVSSYDPVISGQVYLDRSQQMQTNKQSYGVADFRLNTAQSSFNYDQAFPTGTSMEYSLDMTRQATNSIYNLLSPQLYSYQRILVQQQLLAGFGFGPNLRYLHIAKNNRKISDIAFRAQVIATVTQIANIYWDLVNAYDEAQVKQDSYAFARNALEVSRKQLALQAIPEMDVLKAEAEAANREQELTVARTNLQLQELLMKNALTRQLDDATLEEMPVVPLDRLRNVASNDTPVQELIAKALNNRTELQESAIDLQNRELSRKTARNALLPALSLYALYAGSGYAGQTNPNYYTTADATGSTGLGGSLQNAFNNSSPDYQVGISLNIPLRNRVAKADQSRTELEYRQSQIYAEEMRKRIRIEVRNAHYALQQSISRVAAARKARDLSQRQLDIMQQEQKLGAGSSQQTLAAEHDLALASSALVTAETACEKARIEVLRATGEILAEYDIRIEEAKTGVVAEQHP